MAAKKVFLALLERAAPRGQSMGTENTRSRSRGDLRDGRSAPRRGSSLEPSMPAAIIGLGIVQVCRRGACRVEGSATNEACVTVGVAVSVKAGGSGFYASVFFAAIVEACRYRPAEPGSRAVSLIFESCGEPVPAASGRFRRRTSHARRQRAPCRERDPQRPGLPRCSGQTAR